ncbi:uncharacterized protein LOC131153146 isoform X2 [Malania oleifera]|uniref:uncharacterized protein LOC131153146 isoform X2 n=1 Tax=Malania oleifera TaxID=397392 RepID=UPI0025AE582F|nr:uncharacterized protein LOC131153146 isoform X2 [Malania oleifera]
MEIHRVAFIIKNPLFDDKFLLRKQTRPPKFGDDEYDSYIDSDLYDLPSVQLNPLEGDSQSPVLLQGTESCSLDVGKFDFKSAIDEVLEQMGFRSFDGVEWTLWKYEEEAEFGPVPPVQTLFVMGKLAFEDEHLKELGKWMSIQSCLNLLLGVKPGSDRVGPLVVLGLLNESEQSMKLKIPPSLHCQEYPPGVMLVPMGSRTAKPFWTTNLVVFAPKIASNCCGVNSSVAHGDALIVDPGCRSEFHEELKEIVAALPRKLVVFVTHHHHDHVDGLSIIQKCNPDATLMAHENTMRRIGKGDWSLSYISVSGAEDICIGDQQLRVIFAPGHTDGHMALLHTNTHSLIVGDHCVGQGSAVLDITSGGNMNEYFQTTYNFLDLSPHALIPMHGRVNLWPKHMLCAYLKNRRNRELSILKAIENGANTLFDIVSKTYLDVDSKLWIPASSNVMLHVEHLAMQNKLPEEFSVKKFQTTCRLHFLSRWMCAYLYDHFPLKKLTGKLVLSTAVAGFLVLYALKKNKTDSSDFFVTA